MKAIALTLTTLCLAAVTQAKWDYDLKCTREEIGIRWPSYYSNSDYYICQYAGGKQLKNTCPEGELFSFALQSCTAPSKFIPPPPMNILPTSSPLEENSSPSSPSPSNTLNQSWLPKPINSEYPQNSNHPIFNGNEQPPIIDAPVQQRPTSIYDSLHGNKETDAEFQTPPTIAIQPQEPALIEQPEVPSEVPQPPTPPPTPPVVQPPKNKTPPAPPSASKKQNVTKRQPPRPASKKDQAPTVMKKLPLKPVSKAQTAKVQPPKPVSKAQQ